MSIAVIIPVLNEEEALPSQFRWLSPLDFEEIFLVDGGSKDRTVEVAKTFLTSLTHCHSRIISGPKGRSAQMNVGAAEAKTDILLFLHADTKLPHNAKNVIEQALSNPCYVGGRFDVRFPYDRGYAWSGEPYDEPSFSLFWHLHR